MTSISRGNDNRQISVRTNTRKGGPEKKKIYNITRTHKVEQKKTVQIRINIRTNKECLFVYLFTEKHWETEVIN